MPKRSAQEAMQAVVPASKADSFVKSRSGRVVKPKVWDDGTVAAPVAALKEEPAEMAEREGDPDYSDDPVEEHLSDEVGGDAYELESDEDAAYSDGPMGSYGSHGSRGRYGASRDESGKFTHGRARGGRGRGSRGGSSSASGGGIFKMAAVEVLRQEKRLLSTGEIARLALKRGLIKCSGKTPEATMASALYTDIKRREGQSIFIRPHEGLFGLREWIEQGVPFQDDYAEEMAKRARANFGYMMPPGMVPPVVDKEGKPIQPMPYSFPYGAPVPGLDIAPIVPLPGLPPIPGYSQGSKGKGRGKAAAAAAAAAAATHSAEEDNDEGLMQLLNAAEELHRSSSKEEDDSEGAQQGQAHREDAAVDKPSGSFGEGASQGDQGSEGMAHPAHKLHAAHAAAALNAVLLEAQGSQQQHEQHSQHEACSSRGTEGVSMGGARHSAHAAHAGPAGSDMHEEAAALAAMAAHVVEPSAAPSEGSKGEHRQHSQGEEEMAPDSDMLGEQGAAAGLAGLMQTPAIGEGAGVPYGYPHYPYYNPHFNPYHAAAMPQQPVGEEEDEQQEDREGGATVSLVVTGTAKPLQQRQASAMQRTGSSAAAAASGQEQINILNLPLPDFDASEKAAPALPEVSPEQLRQAEALVMRLETELGTSHPEVGKALLSLAKLYMAEGGANSRQLATAAISRAQDIMTVCQVALNRQTTCGSAFDYLMTKAKNAPRAVDITVAAGAAAHVLTSPPPQ